VTKAAKWSLFASLFVFFGCAKSKPDAVSEQSFTSFQVDSLTTRFVEQDAEVPIDPEIAFSLRAYCPKINRARYTPQVGSEMGTLQIWGEDLERVWGVVGRSVTGQLGQSKSKSEPDGSQRFALGCRDCQIVLGMLVEGKNVGCLGPGHSLQLQHGKLVY
jgi:hypothetical protein